MARIGMRRRLGALVRGGMMLAAVLAAAACLSACDSGGDGGSSSADTGEDASQTAFEKALATVGDKVSAAGVGYGWVDLRVLPDAPGGHGPSADEMLPALGPGADGVLETSGADQALGFEIGQADEAISVGGSYVFAVRLGGVPSAAFARNLREAGAGSRKPSGGWRGFVLGPQGSRPLGGPLAPLGSLAARAAVGHDAVVISRSGTATRALTEGGESPLGDPLQALAASCLGDVVAARTLPGAFTHNPPSAPALIAMGVADSGNQVLCTVGDNEEEAADDAASMRKAFAPGATDAITGEPIADDVSSAHVDTVSGGGAYAARAKLRLTTPASRAYLFQTLTRGSLLTFVGIAPPEAR